MVAKLVRERVNQEREEEGGGVAGDAYDSNIDADFYTINENNYDDEVVTVMRIVILEIKLVCFFFFFFCLFLLLFLNAFFACCA